MADGWQGQCCRQFFAGQGAAGYASTDVKMVPHPQRLRRVALPGRAINVDNVDDYPENRPTEPRCGVPFGSAFLWRCF